MNRDIVEKAMRIAARAHKNQVRKDSDLPYIAHPAMVALKLSEHDFALHVIAAGLVHDVLEDTPFTEKELRSQLSDEVADIAVALSEDKSLPWEERKERYIESVRAGSDDVKAVSIADKIHNLESILIAHQKQGPNMWEHFNRPKDKQVWFQDAMLSMFKASWDHPLVFEYESLVAKMKELD